MSIPSSDKNTKSLVVASRCDSRKTSGQSKLAIALIENWPTRSNERYGDLTPLRSSVSEYATTQKATLLLLGLLRGGLLLRLRRPRRDNTVFAGINHELTRVLVCVSNQDVYHIAGIRLGTKFWQQFCKIGVAHAVDRLLRELEDYHISFGKLLGEFRLFEDGNYISKADTRSLAVCR